MSFVVSLFDWLGQESDDDDDDGAGAAVAAAPKARYVKFQQYFLYFGCVELDVRGHTLAQDAAFPCLRFKPAGIVLI